MFGLLACIAAAPLWSVTAMAQQVPASQPATTQPATTQPAAKQPATTQPAATQAAAPPAGTAVSVDELQKLVNTLQSDTDRAQLVAQLQALIAAQRTAEQQPPLGIVLLKSLSDGIGSIAGTLSEAGEQLADISSLGDWIVSAIHDQALRERVGSATWRIVAVLGGGVLALFAAQALLWRMFGGLIERMPRTLGARIVASVLTLLLYLAPLGAFVAAAWVIMPFIVHRQQLRLLLVASINAVLISGVLVAFGRALLQPREPHLRVVRLTDESAAYADLWLRRFVLIAVIGYIALETGTLLGLPYGTHAALVRLLGLLICVMLVIVTLQNRHGIAEALKTRRSGEQVAGATLRGRLADFWHVGAIFYIIAVFVVWLLHPGADFTFLMRATFLTALVLSLAWLIEIGIERLISRAFSISDELKARFPALEARANRYLVAVFVLVRVVMTAISLLIVLRAWGLDSFAVLASDPGRQIIVGMLRIIAIVAGSLLVWEASTMALQRYLERTSVSGRLARSRVQTLLPLARHMLAIVILAIAALMLLSEIGISIGPLLAGAGIVGLAVGLGAQSLVKDLIGGFSLLLEDAVAVGDVVRIGEHAGVVEQMTIRMLRLRGLDGTVQHIPLGSVSVVENMTKDFSYALIDCGVAYRENVDNVIRALSDVGEDMARDPAFESSILAPLEMLGLDRFDESAVVIRCRLKTLPGQQWNVGREFNRRMKAAFDARGIEIPFPYRTLVLGDETVKQLLAMREQIAEKAAPPVDVAPSGQAAG